MWTPVYFIAQLFYFIALVRPALGYVPRRCSFGDCWCKFLQAGCPFCHQTSHVKTLKEKQYNQLRCLHFIALMLLVKQREGHLTCKNCTCD